MYSTYSDMFFPGDLVPGWKEDQLGPPSPDGGARDPGRSQDHRHGVSGACRA
jgi:hypothetical protein